MFPDKINQMNQFLCRSFTPGFFFHSLQNGQIKGISKIVKSVVEGNHLPAAERLKLLGTIAVKLCKRLLQFAEVFFKDGCIFGILCGQSQADVFRHHRCMVWVQPNMRIGFMVMPVFMPLLFVRRFCAQQVNPGRGIYGYFPLQNILHEVFQSCTGHNYNIGSLHSLHLADIQRIIMQA